MLAFDLGCAGINDYEPLHYISQFANISRPGILHQRLESFLGDLARAAAVPRRKFFQEILNQEWNILQTIAQRRHVKRNDVQAIKKILAKITTGALLF